MKYKYINYIINEFLKEYPTASAETFEKVLLKYSEDDLYRTADAIERFGLKVWMSVIHD